MVFNSTFFPCAARDYTEVSESAPTHPFLRAQLRPRPCHPVLLRTRATGRQKRKKGGKIPPAARRFPLSPHREPVKPPLLVPVFRDRLLGQLCDGQPIGFDPGEDRLDDVRGETVQGKNAGRVAAFQAELL